MTATSFFYFLVIYFYHFPKENGENFQYGYKQIAIYIKGHYSKYNKIIVDPKFGEGHTFDGVPHLYIPYFVQLPPQYLLNSKSDLQGRYFDKFEIRAIRWDNEKLQTEILYVVPSSNRPPSNVANTLKTLLEIKYPNNKLAFVLYEKVINSAKLNTYLYNVNDWSF
jgi:hypothetical protein